MVVAGIVAEYNPFHQGHAYQLAQTRKAGATHIVAVMSGNFVQRGEPAIALKHARAKAALANGVDLVIELPVPWSCSAAMTFARGAVSLLDALGFVDLLSFGSESGDVECLQTAAVAVVSEQLNNGAIKEYTAQGMSFASAREAAVRDLFGSVVADVLKNPNDTLAIEYIRVLNELKSGIRPFAIKRVGSGHDKIGSTDAYASASQIRQHIVAGEDYKNLLPSASYDMLEQEVSADNAPALYSRLQTAALYAMRTMTALDIAKAPDISEGIENRIANAAQKATGLEQLFSLAKTKRYTHARIRRIILQSFLGIEASDCMGTPPYIRVLATGEKGKELLRVARKPATLPIVMKAADVAKLDERAKHIFALECRATDIFALSLPVPKSCGIDQKSNVILD